MRSLVFAVVALLLAMPLSAEEKMLQLQPNWEFVADRVMGGVSRGEKRETRIDGRDAVQLVGDVSLENNGGFIQIAFDLPKDIAPEVFTGIRLMVRGNAERYELRLRTSALSRPWQSYRTAFEAPPVWTEIMLPFTDFHRNKTDQPFDPAGLKRIGLLAYGAEMHADIAVAEIGFY